MRVAYEDESYICINRLCYVRSLRKHRSDSLCKKKTSRKMLNCPLKYPAGPTITTHISMALANRKNLSKIITKTN